MDLKERLKNLRRCQDESVREKRLEIHHVTARYTGEEGDLFPLSLPEHARIHQIEAFLADTRKDTNAHFWSVSAIVRRMNKPELEEYNKQPPVKMGKSLHK